MADSSDLAKSNADRIPSAADGPLLIEGPKNADAAAEIPIIDLEPLKMSGTDDDAPASAAETMAADGVSRWKLSAYAPRAAGIALAVVVGALAGAAATAGLMREQSPPVATAATRALHDSVAQLGSELATLKSGLATAQRSTSAQFGKLAERLDRAEKAQAEPAAKLAKIMEAIDRLDRRQQQAAVAPASDITGSVAPKDNSRLPVIEGWRLRDFYAGRAVVESRNGTLFEIGPGSNLPGLGKVESIKRESGKVVVTTRNGIITAALEQRRPPAYLPYRY